MKFLKLVFGFVFLLVLAACGGGGGNAGTVSGLVATDGTPSGTNTSVAVPKITLSVYNSGLAKVNYVSSADVFTAVATVLDASGLPVEGALVTFSTGGFTNLSLASTTRVSDSNGKAEIVVSPSATSSGGGVPINASAVVNGIATTAPQLNVNVAVGTVPAPAAVPKMTLFIYNSVPAKVNYVASVGSFTAVATVLDASGLAVPNKLVTFSTSGSTGLTLASTTMTTDANGEARVVVSPSTASSGGGVSLNASATVNGIVTAAPQLDLNVAAGNVATPTAVPKMTLFVYNSALSKVNYVSSVGVFTAVATVLDATGLPVPNKLVTFSTSGFTSLSLANQTVTTDTNGEAKVVVSPSSISSGGGVSLNASAVVDGITTIAPQIDLNVSAGTGSTAAPTLSVGIYKVGGNTQIYAVSYQEPFEVRATLRDANGVAVGNQLITFDMGAFTNAIVSPKSLVTDAITGIATVSIAPASISAVGGATVKASVTLGGANVSNQTSFNVAATSVSLSAISVGSANLASGGNTSLAVTVSIGGAPASGVPINVAYSASCGRINGSSTAASVTTNGNGVANASYESVNGDGTLCSGPVTLTVTSASASSVSASITVAAPSANAITFMSSGASSQIFVTGAGNVELYVAQFKVLSGSTPLANQSVTFSLLINPGGVGLGTPGSLVDVVASTNSAGVAQVNIYSGTIPGPVKVRAALTIAPAVFAETQNVTVASGPPSQRFMSLSVEKYNIEGWAYDGTTTKLTARVADRQGNAVADGTVINFTAESGQVAYSCTTKQVNNISSCSVDFQSQNPRVSGGRVSVLAFLEGTKDYIDVNGNNRYDPGVDTLISIGDAYRDDDENDSYDSASGEFLIPRGGSAACPGAGRPFPSRVNTCDTSLATTVRQQTVLLYSSSSPKLTLTSAVTASGVSFTLNSLDNILLPMPAGTTITAAASGQSVVLGATVNCSVDKVYGTTVANIAPAGLLTNLGTPHTVTLKDCASGGTNSVAITITAPSGLATTFSYVIP